MDGDSAPLRDLRALCDEFDAALCVDEAHALGVLGPAGRGLCAARQVVPDVLVGTLGKAFGMAGGFLAGPNSLRSLLQSRGRPFVYTTAPPPSLAAAAVIAHDWLLELTQPGLVSWVTLFACATACARSGLTFPPVRPP